MTSESLQSFEIEGNVELDIQDDDESQEAESTDPLVSNTTSVASSLFEHVEDHGRTYHKYKEGSEPKEVASLV